MCRDIERLTLLTDVLISAIRSWYLLYLLYTPEHLKFLFFLGGLIRNPELLIADLIYVFFGYIFLRLILISVQEQNETFS